MGIGYAHNIQLSDMPEIFNVDALYPHSFDHEFYLC